MRRGYLSLAQVMEMLDVSQGTVQRLKSAGELGEYQYAAYNDYPVEAVLSYIEKQIAANSNEANTA